MWTGGEKCKKPCVGDECEKLAEQLKNVIDINVDPCQDFFAFACSSRPQVTPIQMLEDETLAKDPPQGYEYINKFYRSCIEISDFYTVEEVFAECTEGDGRCTERELKEHGAIYIQFLHKIEDFFKMTLFPAVNPNWEEESKNWFGGSGWTWWDVSATVLKDNFYLAAFHDGKKDTFRSNVFFAPLINKFSGFGRTHTIHIVPMTIPGRLDNPEFLEKYKRLMKGILMTFGADSSTVGRDMERILEMEQQLLNIGLPQSFSDFHQSLTIRELANLVPSVPWKDFIESTLSHNTEQCSGGLKVRGNTRVKIPSKRLMRELGSMLEGLDGRDTANLLIWRMFIRFANDFMKTGAAHDDLQLDPFTQHCPGLSIKSSRRENCLCQIRTLFPEAFFDMQIGKMVSRTKKEGIKQIFHNMAKEFEDIIEEQDWMSMRTKITAKEKVRNMGINVGEQSPNTTEFWELKDKMDSKDYINNILAIGNYEYDTLVKLVGEDVRDPKGRDLRAEFANNAYYFPQNNEMRILTGLIGSWFGQGLSFHIPKSIIYGGHGSTTLGHEMVHGFDNSGKMYDKDGFHLNWWSASEDWVYENRTECLVSVYSFVFINILFKRKQYRDFTITYGGVPYSVPGMKLIFFIYMETLHSQVQTRQLICHTIVRLTSS